ncbi:hypothetical protein PENTCL1PPCAC_7052, partial [Pristionchus entomophagus]
RSSLIFEVLLHINRPFSCIFFVVMVILMAYKGTVLPYAVHVYTVELLLLLLFAPIEALRFVWGSRGNLTETSAFISFFVLLSIANIALCVYLGVFQSYVLLIEEILICIEFALLVLQTLIGVTLIATLSR